MTRTTFPAVRFSGIVVPMLIAVGAALVPSATAQVTIAPQTGALSLSVDNGRAFYLNGNDEFCTSHNIVKSISVAGGAVTNILDEPGCTLDGRFTVVDVALGFTVGRRGTAWTIDKFWSGGLSADPIQIGTIAGG